MGDPLINERVFVCTVGHDEIPRSVFISAGSPAMGLSVELIVTPVQALDLARHLTLAAEAISVGKEYDNEEN